MKHCPLCGEGKLPEIKAPGIIFVQGVLLYNHNFVASFGFHGGRTKAGDFLEITLRWWPEAIPHERCIYAVWPYDDEPSDPLNTLTVYAHNIRRKIGRSGLDFRSRNGMGYKFYMPDELKAVSGNSHILTAAS